MNRALTVTALGSNKCGAQFPKDAILGFQIVDRRRLLPLQPTSDQHEQELQQSCGGSHLGVDVELLGPPASTTLPQANRFMDAAEFPNSTA
jgi:hypothetical protein